VCKKVLLLTDMINEALNERQAQLSQELERVKEQSTATTSHLTDFYMGFKKFYTGVKMSFDSSTQFKAENPEAAKNDAMQFKKMSRFLKATRPLLLELGALMRAGVPAREGISVCEQKFNAFIAESNVKVFKLYEADDLIDDIANRLNKLTALFKKEEEDFEVLKNRISQEVNIYKA
jgi:hypothetical protein